MMGASDILGEPLARDLLKFNEDGYDIYYIPNILRSDFVGVKPKDSDVISYNSFVIDLDMVAPPTTDDYAQLYTNKHWDVMVYSGRGLQLHCRLLGEGVDTARRVGAYLNQLKMDDFGLPAWRVDTCTSDAARMVRMPGTINQKSGRRAEILFQRPTSDFFMPYIRLPEAPVLADLPPFQSNIDLTNLSIVAPRLNAIANRYLIIGIDSKMESRHKAAFAAARCLYELGVGYDTAKEWILSGASIASPKLNPSEALHCVRTAYKNSA